VRSLAIQTVFHTGSLAFAAFIIAIFSLIRTIVLYIEKQSKAAGQQSMAVALVFKGLLCCISCLKKTVEVVSFYGLVFVAVNGNSFCGGCYKTFVLVKDNVAQVSINALVTWLIKMFSLGTTPLACAAITFFITDGQGNPSPFWPAFVVFLLAFVMTQACMTVFECIITTIFVCSFEDNVQYGGRYMQQHPHLIKAFGLDTGKEKDKLISTESPDTKPDVSVKAQSL
jgi:choline transporter-like protein 2/4/5